MKTLKLFLLPVLGSLEFGWQLIRYTVIFVSAFFRQRASLGCEIVAVRSQLTFYEESIRQKRQPHPRFNPAFRLLWVLLSSVWTGWKSAAELMKPKTVLKWHEHAFLKWWSQTQTCGQCEPLGFDSRGRRFTPPLHPSGRLIFTPPNEHEIK